MKPSQEKPHPLNRFSPRGILRVIGGGYLIAAMACHVWFFPVNSVALSLLFAAFLVRHGGLWRVGYSIFVFILGAVLSFIFFIRIHLFIGIGSTIFTLILLLLPGIFRRDFVGETFEEKCASLFRLPGLVNHPVSGPYRWGVRCCVIGGIGFFSMIFLGVFGSAFMELMNDPAFPYRPPGESHLPLYLAIPLSPAFLLVLLSHISMGLSPLILLVGWSMARIATTSKKQEPEGYASSIFLDREDS